MSSFVGHGLAAVAVTLPNIKRFSSHRRWAWGWLLWLIVVAWGPDIDYIWPVVHPSAHNGLRITHSVAASFLLPTLTLAVLWNAPRSWLPALVTRRFLCVQVMIVGLSHLLLDLLVGVTPLPLLYPFSVEAFRLPFGILPSAGKIDVKNYYFWRNLFLELGVLLPLLISWCIHVWTPLEFRSEGNGKMRTGVKWVAIALCIALSSTFIHECYHLPRT